MTNAYIQYRGEKVYVTVDSSYEGLRGLTYNVTAIQGYPFLSADLFAQGKTSGAFNCNGYRVSADYLMVDPHPVEEAYRIEHEEWLDEQATRESVRPF